MGPRSMRNINRRNAVLNHLLISKYYKDNDSYDLSLFWRSRAFVTFFLVASRIILLSEPANNAMCVVPDPACNINKENSEKLPPVSQLRPDALVRNKC